MKALMWIIILALIGGLIYWLVTRNDIDDVDTELNDNVPSQNSRVSTSTNSIDINSSSSLDVLNGGASY